MTNSATPEIQIPTELAAAIGRLCECVADLDVFEASVLSKPTGAPNASSFLGTPLPGWDAIRQQVWAAWRTADHLVLRKFPLGGAGVSLILAASLLGGNFRSYRGRQIVKRFTMSPWTRDLSHTIAEGDFHTDLNTHSTPPLATAIQCIEPDPCPTAGELRVARATDILKMLGEAGHESTVRFMVESQVCMVNDSSPECWRGQIIENGEIRLHPQTLIAAQRRLGDNPPSFEEHLAKIKEASMASSRPIHLEPGEALLVSNRRALHYRGACTVRFRNFPREFDSRSIYVLHLMDEPPLEQPS